MTVFRSAAFVLGVAPAALVAFGLGTYVEQSIYRYPEFANVLLATLVALPFVTDLAVLGGAYRGVLKPEPSIVASYVLQPTFRAIVMITLFALGWRLWAVVVGTSVSYVITWVILALRAQRELVPAGSTGRLDRADMLSVLRYSSTLAASLVFASCIRSTDSLFLGHFGSAADVGQYGAVVLVTQLIGLAGFAIGQTLAARVALRHQVGDIAGIERLLAETIRLISLFSAPAFAAIVFWGDRIDLALGPTFAVSGSVVSIVAARMLVLTMFGYTGFALSMTGRHLLEMGLLGVGLLASVVLCLVLVPRYGQIGAALAGLISFSMINVGRYAVVRSVFGIKPIKLAAIKPVAWAIAVAGTTDLVLHPFDDRTVLSTLIAVAVFATSFAISAWFVLVTQEDREKIVRLCMPRSSIAKAHELSEVDSSTRSRDRFLGTREIRRIEGVGE